MTDAVVWRRCTELAEAGEPFVVVTLVEAIGSTPQDTGAKMVVSGRGLETGTVGGGRVEAKAIGHAKGLLASGSACEVADWSLKADVGMTCGGRVKLLFEPQGVSPWRIAVFGAGHVAQSLTRLLVTLPCQVACIDPRPDWLAKLPEGVATIEADEPADQVARLPADTYIVCMTKGHATDLPVLQQVYGGGKRFPFVGAIGSKAKAAVLRRDLADRSITELNPPLRCPIGLPIGSNHPGEIAVSIAAQLIEARDTSV